MNEDLEQESANFSGAYGLPPKSPGAYSNARFDFPLHSAAPNFGSGSIYSDTVAIFVNSEWSTDVGSGFSNFEKNALGQVQLCPAIFAPGIQHVPQIVKHVYGRLAAAATELDQGVPELLLSFVGSGNSLNYEDFEHLVRGLSRIITRCGFWAVTSGEQNDPLAVAIASALRLILPQRETDEETLVIVVNSSNVIYKAQSISSAPNSRSVAMTDSRYNTFYVVWNKSDVTEHEMHKFRSCMAINLANPPLALLIGVPNNAGATNIVPLYDEQTSITVPPTPSGAVAPTILLPNFANPKAERIPLPAALYCGATLASLNEFDNYLQCGVPVLVIQDSNELCSLIKSSFVLYQSAGFEHSRFIDWIDVELRRVILVTHVNGLNSETMELDLEIAKQCLCRILASGLDGERPLVAFMCEHNLENLADHLLNLLVRSVADNVSLVSVLNLAVKLNVASVVRSIKLESVLANNEQIETLILEALKSDDQTDVLCALLDQNIPIQITSNLLLNWLNATSDHYFFNTIILGHFLGFTYKLNSISEGTAIKINQFLQKMSGGLSCLFPVECFGRNANRGHLLTNDGGAGNSSNYTKSQHNKSTQVLAIWALLLNRTELVKLLCAYSHEPIALSLVLAKIARNLSRKSREWFFYEQKLLTLSSHLNSVAVSLLDSAYLESPMKAYRALCHRPSLALAACADGCAGAVSISAMMRSGVGICCCLMSRLTLAELAFEMNSREFIAHDCCQRFVLRLLYGNLQIRTLSSTILMPNWFKISMSALFVAPIAVWVTSRPNTLAPTNLTYISASALKSHLNDSDENLTYPHLSLSSPRRQLSPTVALLEEGRQVRKIRANSVYSMHSMKSSYLHEGSLAGGGFSAGNVYLHDDRAKYFVNNGGIEPRSPDSANETDAFLPHFLQQHQTPFQRTPSSNSVNGAKAPSRSGRSVVSAAASGKKNSRKKSSKSTLAMVDRICAAKNKTKTKKLERIANYRPNNFSADFVMLYSTPITKYWLSLIFRLAYLTFFAYSIALPSCGFLSTDFIVWIWSFMWLVESLWIFNTRLQNCFWREMSWTIFDITCVSCFLFYLFLGRIVGSQFMNLNALTRIIGFWYNVKSMWALFLLYECYKTLFIYIPLSNVLGPLLIRIKLMITRDFSNFFVLVLLVILSSAIAIKATLYTDKELNTIGSSISWSFLQLLTTDLSVLNQTEECKKIRFSLLDQSALHDMCMNGEKPKSYAGVSGIIGGYANSKCSTQAWFSHFTVLEYFVVLKLISWPILFALFARTAKRVDEEAEQIWKYQLYSLATNFSARPFLPPPLTPFFFVIMSCCRMTGCISEFFQRLNSGSSDHPDVCNRSSRTLGNTLSPVFSTHSKFSTVYRNPSVPSSKVNSQNAYWRYLSVKHWKNTKKKEASTLAASAPSSALSEKIDLLFLLNNFYRNTPSATFPLFLPSNAATTSSLSSSPTFGQRNSFCNKAAVGIAAPNCNTVNSNNDITVELSPSSDVLNNSNGTKTSMYCRLRVDSSCKDWNILLPSYCPLKYSKAMSEFPIEIQKCIQDYSTQCLFELQKYWRQRRLTELLTTTKIFEKNQTDVPHVSVVLSGDGLPLNPYGRTGLAGRGEYTRFGANTLYFYAVFVKDKSGSLFILTTKLLSNNKKSSCNSAPKYGLPSKWRYGVHRADEFLSKLLFLVGVPDTDTQLMTSRSHLTVGQVDAHLAHVVTQPLPQPQIDTDNAWTEADVWAVDLSYLPEYREQLDDSYEWKRIENLNKNDNANTNSSSPSGAAQFLPDNIQTFVDLSLKAFFFK